MTSSSKVYKHPDAPMMNQYNLRLLFVLFLLCDVVLSSEAPPVCDGSVSSGANYPWCSRDADLLRGLHLNITTIEQIGFVNMDKDEAGSIIFEDAASGLLFKSTPQNQYYNAGGFVIDMIGWIAKHAGFTYSLYTPSGVYSHDPNDQNFIPYDQKLTKSYGTGQLDVWNNRTQLYWAMYYITNYRRGKNLYTIPFLSGNGLTVSMSATAAVDPWVHFANIFVRGQNPTSGAYKILQTFSLDLWVTSLALFFLCAIIFWILEGHREQHSGRFVPRKDRDLKPYVHEFLNSPEGGYARKPLMAIRQNQLGLLTRDSFRELFSSYFERTFLTFTAHSSYEPRTREGKIFNMCVCLFAIIWGAAFTANLSAILNSDSVDTGIRSFSDLVTSKKVACLPEGYSYTSWVISAFPKMNYRIVHGGDEGSKQSLRDFERLGVWSADGTLKNCEAMISCEFVMREHSNNPASCDDNLKVVSDRPLQWGLSDLAVGVNYNYPEIERGLSYWIQELRNCAPDNPTSVCFNGLNMAGLYTKWVDSGKCDTDANNSVKSLDVSNFAAPITMLVGVGLACVMFSLNKNKRPLLDKLNAKWGRQNRASKTAVLSSEITKEPMTRLYKYVASNHPDCIINFELRPYLFIEKLRAHETEDSFVNPLVDQLKAFYISADIGAYQLLKDSVKLLAKNKLILLEDQQKGFVKHEVFLNQSIYNCLDTIEMLTWRALREDKEWRKMRTTRLKLKQIIRDYGKNKKQLPRAITNRFYKSRGKFVNQESGLYEEEEEFISSVRLADRTGSMMESARASYISPTNKKGGDFGFNQKEKDGKQQQQHASSDGFDEIAEESKITIEIQAPENEKGENDTDNDTVNDDDTDKVSSDEHTTTEDVALGMVESSPLSPQFTKVKRTTFKPFKSLKLLRRNSDTMERARQLSYIDNSLDHIVTKNRNKGRGGNDW